MSSYVTQALWSVCCSLRPAFWQSYVAMQHYRLKVGVVLLLLLLLGVGACV